MDQRMKDKKSIWPAACAGAFLCFTLLFLGPMDMYLTNIGDLWFGIGEFWWRLGLTAAVAWVICTAVFLLLRKLNGKLYLYAVALLFGGAVAIYVQGNFLSIGAAALEGGKAQASGNAGSVMLNLGIWALLAFSPVVLSKLFPKKMHNAAGYLSLAFLAMQVVAVVVSLISTPLDKDRTMLYMSNEGQFEMSKNENIVVLMADSFGIDYFDEIMEKDPQALDYLDGFTYYQNSVGSYRRTIPAYGLLMTGAYYRNEVPYEQYISDQIEKDTFWHELKEMGYSVRISEDYAMHYQPEQREVYDNLIMSDMSVSSHLSLCKVMLRMTGYRFGPELIKPYLLIDFMDVFNSYKTSSKDTPEKYSKADAMFYDDLKNDMPMSARYDEKAFRLYFLMGTHAPYTLNENARRVSESETDRYKQSLGVMTIFREYISQLKALGLYDQTTIILMADHSHETENQIGSPIFLIKPKGATGELTVSAAPISHADFRSTLMKAAGGDYKKYGTPVDEWNEGDNRARFYYRYTAAGHTEYLKDMTEWVVEGDARDVANFKETGKVYGKGFVNETN